MNTLRYDARYIQRHINQDSLSFFLSLTFSTYSLLVQRVTVAPDLNHGHDWWDSSGRETDPSQRQLRGFKMCSLGWV